MKHWGLKPIIVCSNYDPGLWIDLDLFDRKDKFGNRLFYRKTVNFSETIAANDLKGSRSRHLIKYMKICEYSKVKVIS